MTDTNAKAWLDNYPKEEPPTRPEPTSVRVHSLDSARLHRIAREVMGIRKRAEHVQTVTSAAIERVKNDTTLSTEAKNLELERIKETEKPELRELRDQELAFLEAEAKELDRRLDGIIGLGPSDLIAYRDAQDRADQLVDSDHAKRVMDRALRSDDRTLAHAVYRRALESGWRQPLDGFHDEVPRSRRDDQRSERAPRPDP